MSQGQGHYLTFDPRLSKYDNFKHLDPQNQISTSLLGRREQISAQQSRSREKHNLHSQI